MAKTLDERFWEKVSPDPGSDCLVWTGARNGQGYGNMWVGGYTRSSHRVAWYLAYDKWPEHTLDHLCRNRGCVNVHHLEDVTHEVNAGRGKASRTECSRGHKYTRENTLILQNGHRRCRECHRARDRRYRARQKDKALA